MQLAAIVIYLAFIGNIFQEGATRSVKISGVPGDESLTKGIFKILTG